LLEPHVTETRTQGGDVESGHAVTAIAPVVAGGVGVRHPGGWALRLVSFRLERSDLGSATLGILTPRSVSSSALVEVLAGRIAPSCGNLRVLGYDMTTASGRAAARRQVGRAGRAAPPMTSTSIRRHVERAARRSGQPGSDRGLLVAAVLDRLGLAPWSQVPLGAAPDLIARKARLAAACVHQPKLLLIDGLLDRLSARDRIVLADAIRDVERDTAVIAFSDERDTLLLVCEQVACLAGGILTGRSPDARYDPPGRSAATIAAYFD
jgi:ABC-type multidrug transport system ATPase subunit